MRNFFSSRPETLSLFDVHASYNRSLAIARLARGEPHDPAERSVWKARLWLKMHRQGLLRTGVSCVALFGGYLVLRFLRQIPEFHGAAHLESKRGWGESARSQDRVA